MDYTQYEQPAEEEEEEVEIEEEEVEIFDGDRSIHQDQTEQVQLNKKSIEQVDIWTNIWLIKYPQDKCIWTKLQEQLNKCWIEQIVKAGVSTGSAWRNA